MDSRSGSCSPTMGMSGNKPTYCTPNPVPNIPENNQVKLIEFRSAKLAAFTVEGRELICLPQAFDLFLKHLVGGLHTVYTKLKRLEISPVVCNVEQVRILRSLGAIQPGVNRCKLIGPSEFDILYEDCTNSSARPGRPPKRSNTASPDQHGSHDNGSKRHHHHHHLHDPASGRHLHDLPPLNFPRFPPLNDDKKLMSGPHYPLLSNGVTSLGPGGPYYSPHGSSCHSGPPGHPHLGLLPFLPFPPPTSAAFGHSAAALAAAMFPGSYPHPHHSRLLQAAASLPPTSSTHHSLLQAAVAAGEVVPSVPGGQPTSSPLSLGVGMSGMSSGQSEMIERMNGRGPRGNSVSLTRDNMPGGCASPKHRNGSPTDFLRNAQENNLLPSDSSGSEGEMCSGGGLKHSDTSLSQYSNPFDVMSGRPPFLSAVNLLRPRHPSGPMFSTNQSSRYRRHGEGDGKPKRDDGSEADMERDATNYGNPPRRNNSGKLEYHRYHSINNNLMPKHQATSKIPSETATKPHSLPSSPLAPAHLPDSATNAPTLGLYSTGGSTKTSAQGETPSCWPDRPRSVDNFTSGKRFSGGLHLSDRFSGIKRGDGPVTAPLTSDPNNGDASSQLTACVIDLEHMLHLLLQNSRMIEHLHATATYDLRNAVSAHRSKSKKIEQQLLEAKQRRYIFHKKWKKEKQLRRKLEQIMTSCPTAGHESDRELEDRPSSGQDSLSESGNESHQGTVTEVPQDLSIHRGRTEKVSA